MKILTKRIEIFFIFFLCIAITYAQQLTFVTNTISVGTEPCSLAVTDVNGDNKPDLVTANLSDNTLTVLTNNGFGLYETMATLYGESQPFCVIAADINNDTHPDLICANYGNDTLLIWTNNDSGVFGSNAVLNTSHTVYVVAVDVNNDGKLDLVSANGNTNTLTIFTNNGNGIFSSNVTYTVGNAPACIVAADVNGDGKVDLITANYGNSAGDTLTVLTNNGSGIFSLNATLTVGTGPLFVAAVDVNGDGKTDLISANYGGNPAGNTLTVLTNNGSGIFSSNATLNVGNEPAWVAVTDINNDGKIDLISANEADNTLTILTNNGTGIFNLDTTLWAGESPRTIMPMDVNNDGKVDLICGSGHFLVNALTLLIQTTNVPPLLMVTMSGTNVATISWPLFTPGFMLETNSDLTTTNWGNLNYITTTNGQFKNVVIDTFSQKSLFFRLINNE